MTQNEIRLGNWFIGFDDKPFQWKLGHFGLLKDGTGLDELIKAPVIVDMDVLYKAGLTQINDSPRFYEEWVLPYSIPLFRIVRVWYKDFKWWSLMPDIQIKWSVDFGYLHQLQNLVFGITGKELEVKL